MCFHLCPVMGFSRHSRQKRGNEMWLSPWRHHFLVEWLSFCYLSFKFLGADILKLAHVELHSTFILRFLSD